MSTAIMVARPRDLGLAIEAGMVLARKYELLRPAGFGGMAQLWVARNQATGAEVCVKILVAEGNDAESVERFRREAYAAARLNHRAIIRIFDLVELDALGDETAGSPTALAIVMELLKGETLGDYLLKHGRLSLDEAVELALPIVSALAHAHRAGVVHRDLKPDNIFLSADPDGHVIPKVLDFGVSKLQLVDAKSITVDGVMLGTPTFMSPEQARGAPDVDARSDVFSAGTLLYLMLTGTNPFESDSFHSVVSAVLHREVPPIPSIPEALWEVLERALAKSAGERYADASELGIALRRASGRSSLTDPGSGLRGSGRPFSGESALVAPVSDGEVESGEPLSAATGQVARRSRRLAVRVLGAAVAAALALPVVALLRAPKGSSAASAAGASASPPRAFALASAAENATPTARPVGSVVSFGSASPAPEPSAAPGPTDAGALVLEGAPSAAPSPVPAPRRREPPPRSRESGRGPGAAPRREPSIVRDPGF